MVKLLFLSQSIALISLFHVVNATVEEIPIEIPSTNRSSDEYTQAVHILSHLEVQKEPYLYNEYNIEEDLKIPEYSKLDERIINLFKRVELSAEEKKAIELLESSADLNNTQALHLLGDIHFFGNFSHPYNVSKAVGYYEKLVDLEPHADTYYKLGFIYSTGMYGEYKVDQSKANIYYQFGMENGDLRSEMALAYRYLHGISFTANCGLALNYYSHLASQSLKLVTDGPIGGPNIDSFDIRLPDFQGGVFGEDGSEVYSSLIRTKKNHGYDKHIFNEINIDPEEHESVDEYYQAFAAYEGDYFTKRDYKKAFEIAYRCSVNGARLLERTKSPPDIDTLFIGRCNYLLGHMYLRGEGTKQDYAEALHWLKRSKTVPASALNDLGMIYEFGLGVEKDEKTAKGYYLKAANNGYSDASFNMARQFLIEDELNPKGVETMQKAALYGSTPALYHLGQLYERGFTDKGTCEDIVVIYKAFVERMESLVTSLEWAFDEFLRGEYRNALIGYGMAAEQGFEASQVSASYLLYQPKPVLDLDGYNFTKARLEPALSYLIRSSKQNNHDSLVVMGDLYYNGLLGEGPDYAKALSCYHAGHQQHNGQATFNLGYMYEHGLGVDKDFHMAKRYYDLSLEYHKKGYLPVKIANLKLWFKTFFTIGIEDDSHKEPKKTFRDWLKMFSRERFAAEDKASGEAVRDNSFRRSSQTQAQHNELMDGFEFEDVIILGFLVMTFGLFYFMHLRNQRRRAQNVNNNEPQERPRFQVNFFVAPL